MAYIYDRPTAASQLGSCLQISEKPRTKSVGGPAQQGRLVILFTEVHKPLRRVLCAKIAPHIQPSMFN